MTAGVLIRLQDIPHAFGRSAKSGPVAVNHNGAFDQDGIFHHGLDQCFTRQIWIVKAILAVRGLLTAHQVPWLHAQHAEKLLEFLGRWGSLEILNDRRLMTIINQYLQRLTRLAAARIMINCNSQQGAPCTSSHFNQFIRARPYAPNVARL